jgi:RNA polymerase sigma-70 factor (ECF subfamily)
MAVSAEAGGAGGDRDGSAVRGESVAAAAAFVAAAWDAHAAMVRARVLRLVREPAVADDVVQDAFERLLAEASAGRAPANVRAWISRVATNLVVSAARRRSVAARRSSDLLNRAVVPSPEDVLLARESASVLDERLGGMPEHVRTAFVLAAHGFTGAEIARRIGRSELATRSLLSRQRRRLRGLDRPAA